MGKKKKIFLFDIMKEKSSLFSRLQGILTRKDIIRLMHEANASEKFEN